MNSKAARLGLLLAGAALACTFASTAVAFKFRWETGWPWLAGWFYSPLDAWRWWQAWGQFETPYGRSTHRAEFLRAITLTVPLFVLPAMIMHFCQMHSPMKRGKAARLAGFGTVRKLLKTGHVARNGDGVVLGVDPGRWPWRQRTVRDNGDGHVLIVGPSGMGKGAGNIVPTALSHRGSMLIYDPKHELADITGRWRRTLGPVFVVNPTDSRSARFNPLDEVRKDCHLIGDCTRIAYILIPAADRNIGSEKFWNDSARAVLTALLVHVVCSDEPTLGHVWRLIHDVVRGRMPQVRDPDARALLDDLKEAHDTTRRGINKSLSTNLEFLVDPLIRSMISSSDFRAGDLQAGDSPVTVFFSPPVSDVRRLGPLMRLMIEACATALTAELQHTSDGRPKTHKLLGMIDEFPQLGRMDALADLLPVARGFGIRLCLVCQSENQIKNLYGQNQSFTDNCLTRVYIAGLNPDGLQTATKLGGDHAVAHSSKQMPFGLRGSASMSQSETRVSLLEAGEMLERAEKEVVIFTHGLRPTYLKKLRYWKEREFRGRWDEQGTGTVPTPCSGGAVYAEPEPIANEPADNLEPDDQAMLDSIEELLKDVPGTVQVAIRKRLGA